MKITVRTPAEFQKPDLSIEEERKQDAEISKSVRRQFSEQTGQPYCSYFRDEDDPDCPYVVETLGQNPTRLPVQVPGFSVSSMLRSPRRASSAGPKLLDAALARLHSAIPGFSRNVFIINSRRNDREPVGSEDGRSVHEWKQS